MSSPFPHDWVFDHAASSPDSPAISTPTLRLSYIELADRVRAMASRLRLVGVRPGDHVVVALSNSPAMVVMSLAAQSIGGVPVEVDRQSTEPTLRAILDRIQPRWLMIGDRDVDRWGTLLTDRQVDGTWVVSDPRHAPGTRPWPIQSPWETVAVDGRTDEATGDLEVPIVTSDPASPAVVLFTSGSTGAPHGVVQSFHNISANTRSIVEYLGLSREDRALLTLPIHYSYGRSVLQTHLFVGGSIHLDDRFAFPRVVLEAIATERCTGFAGVPLTFEILRRQVAVAEMSFPHLRYVTQAGGAMALDTARWVREAFRPAELFIMYGQTEATARLAYLPPAMAATKPGSIGIAIPGVTLRVVDEDGHDLPPDEVGELVATGPNVTSGYIGDPEATATILHDGLLWTGDLAYRDAEGYFFIAGRSKEILKVGGHRVSLTEIEQVLTRHPDVDDAAAVGVPDALLGEVPAAFVVLASGAAVGAMTLLEHCRRHLPSYAIPATVTFLETLPRGSSGKLRRAELPGSARP